MEFEGSVALVTGANRGIGLAFARARGVVMQSSCGYPHGGARAEAGGMERSYAELPNGVVGAANGISYAYRETGGHDGAVPVLLLQHFRGNLDSWDPALVDALARSRRVITFDNAGVGGLIPQARLKIYPDSAHGFLFQHHAEFAADVTKFLD
jgi:hypothetical protein